MLAEMASDEEFEAYIDHLLKSIAPGTGFVVGIADTTPPAANIDRIRRLADRIRTEGVLPLKAGSFDPISPERMAQATQTAVPLVAAGGDLEIIQQDVFRGDQDAIGAHIQTLLDRGVEGRYILDHGLIAAMEIIGPKFKAGELFIPEVLLSARAMNQGLTVLEPHLASDQKEGAGRILIGAVKGDLHDIGKNMVATMLKGVGFAVIDLGIDVPTEQFLSAIKEHKPHIVGLSSLLTTTMPAMRLVIDALTEAGLRSQVKVIVGGAPVNQNYADQIGADGYAEDASVAVELAKKLTRV
jgi:5-methyltetrahydrofolate--homocysteine methyltransferase